MQHKTDEEEEEEEEEEEVEVEETACRFLLGNVMFMK